MSGAASQFVWQLKRAGLVFPPKIPDLLKGKQELPSQVHRGTCRALLNRHNATHFTPSLNSGPQTGMATQTRASRSLQMTILNQTAHRSSSPAPHTQRNTSSRRDLFIPPFSFLKKKKSFTENLLKSSFQIHLVALSSPLENAVQQLFCSCAASAREI